MLSSSHSYRFICCYFAARAADDNNDAPTTASVPGAQQSEYAQPVDSDTELNTVIFWSKYYIFIKYFILWSHLVVGLGIKADDSSVFLI